MITYLVTQEGRHAIDEPPWLGIGPVRDHFEIVPYIVALHRREWRAGTVIFSDIDRLQNRQIPDVTELWLRLRAAGANLVNHPTRSLMRYGLLRLLREQGINSFDVYRADEQRTPARFPVFLHGERDHKGPLWGRINSKAELQQVLLDLSEKGIPPNLILIVEFIDVQSPDGLYRKYNAYMVGDRIRPRSLFFSHHWNVKEMRTGIPDHIPEERLFAEEMAFLNGNPHEKAVRTIFGMAGIRYGRLDYSLNNGRIEVWEINTNPMHMMRQVPPGNPRYDEIFLPFNAWLHEALLALPGATATGRIRIEPVLVAPARPGL